MLPVEEKWSHSVGKESIAKGRVGGNGREVAGRLKSLVQCLMKLKQVSALFELLIEGRQTEWRVL